MTMTPPSAKGLPVGGLATAVPTWRLCSQRLVDAASEQLLNLLDLRPSCDTTHLYDPILHCSKNVARGNDGTVEDVTVPRRADLCFSVTPMDTKRGRSYGSKLHWAGLALDLDRNELSAGDLAMNQAERCTTSPWTVYFILLGLPLMPQ